MSRILITGASGYIGARLTDLALERGFKVVAAVRSPSRLLRRTGLAIARFDLLHLPDLDELLEGVAAVIHLAAVIHENSQPAGVDEDVNVSGTRALLEASRAAGVSRFVFVSSQSAREGAPTRYGRSKYEIERLLNREGEVVLVPGMVTGGPRRGVYGQLARLVRRLPIVPVIRPEAPVYPIHLDDVCTVLLDLVSTPLSPPARVRLAPTNAWTFGDYLRTIAHQRFGRRSWLLPVPLRPALVAAKLTERLPFLSTVSSERVMGLAALEPMADDGETVAWTERPLREVAVALGAEGRRRRLLLEGRALCRYVMGSVVSGGVLRRYTRAISLRLEDREPLDPPPRIRRWNEPLSTDSELKKRIAIATRIVEATPEGAALFHRYERGSRLTTLLSLGGLLVVEVVFLPVRWFLSRARRPMARRPPTDTGQPG